MRLRFNFIILLIASTYANCFGQVGGSYSLIHNPAYTEYYWFNNEQKIFEHHRSTNDDEEHWMGRGTYTEDKKTVTLKYEALSLPFNSMAEYPVTSDTAKIYWYTLWDEKQEWFQIMVIDSNGKEVFMVESYFGVAYIPREYRSPVYTYKLLRDGQEEITTFSLTDKTDEAHIYFNPPDLHVFSNPTLQLTKTKKGFTVLDTQEKTEKLFIETALPPIISLTDQTCARNRNFTAVELRKRHPFNLATTVKLIAFEAKQDETPLDKTGELRESDCKQIISLTQIQIDSLVDLLYNVNYQDSLNIITLTHSCYSPRHAIIFYNKFGKLFAYLELCFQCTGNHSNIHLYDFGDFYTCKYELLESFFRQSGITFFSADDKTSRFEKVVEEPVIDK